VVPRNNLGKKHNIKREERGKKGRPMGEKAGSHWCEGGRLTGRLWNSTQGSVTVGFKKLDKEPGRRRKESWKGKTTSGGGRVRTFKTALYKGLG